MRFEEQSRAEAAAAMGAFLTEPVLTSTLDLLGDPPAALRGVSPDVERLLGRPGRSFAVWARDHVAAFR